MSKNEKNNARFLQSAEIYRLYKNHIESSSFLNIKQALGLSMHKEKFRRLLVSCKENNNYEQVKKLISSQYAVDIAVGIAEFEDEELKAFLDSLEAGDIASILEKAPPSLQKKIIETIGTDETISIFSFISVDDIADIMGLLSINHRKGLLRQMKQNHSEERQTLLGLNPDTASGIMTTQYIAAKENLSIRETLQKSN